MLSLFHKTLFLLSLSYCVTPPITAANTDSQEKNPHLQMIAPPPLSGFSSIPQEETSENSSIISLTVLEDASSATQPSLINTSLNTDNSHLNKSSSSDGLIESPEQNSTKESSPFALIFEKALQHKKTIKTLKRHVFSIYRVEDLIPELLKTPLLWQYEIPFGVLERIRRFSIKTKNTHAAALLAIYSNQFLSEGNFRKKGQVLKNILIKASKHSESITENVLYQVCLSKLNVSLYHRSSKSWKKCENMTNTLDTLITRVIREHKETMDQNIASFLQREYAHFVGCQPQFYTRNYDSLMTGLRYLSMYSGKGHSNSMFNLGIHCMDINVPLQALMGWNRKIKTPEDRIYWGLGFLQTSLKINPSPSRFNLAKEKAIGVLGLQKGQQLFGKPREILSLELDHTHENQSQS